MQGSSFIQKNGGDSLTKFLSILSNPVTFEGENTGPTTLGARNMGVDFQVEGDPELGTPYGNNSDLIVSLDISR